MSEERSCGIRLVLRHTFSICQLPKGHEGAHSSVAMGWGESRDYPNPGRRVRVTQTVVWEQKKPRPEVEPKKSILSDEPQDWRTTEGVKP